MEDFLLFQRSMGLGIFVAGFFFSGLGEVVSKNDFHEVSSGTKSCTFWWDNTPNKL